MTKTAVFLDTGLSEVTGGIFQSRVGREEIGAQIVAACCQEKADWNIRYLRPDSRNIEAISSVVRDGGCDVLVLFPYTYTKWLADGVAQLFKGKIPIIYGGYHAGIGDNAKKVFEEGIADYIISGPGHHALPCLLQELTAKKVPSKILDGQIDLLSETCPFKSVWAIRDEQLMQNLDEEPLCFKPPANLEPNPRKCVVIAGAIGCSSNCDFCSSWKIASPPLHRSPKDIVKEMIWLRREYGPGLVYFFSNPLFNADRNWMIKLCAEMERAGPFPSICLPDFCLDREMVQAMKRAGIYLAMLGLEFVDTQLRTKRGKRSCDPITAYQLCAEEGIVTRAFFMLGRLGMTREDLKAEVEALLSLPFRADQLRINFEVPFPGTECAHKLSAHDIVTDQSRWTTEEVVYRTGLSQEEWQEERAQITKAYHFNSRQERHYDQQVARFPELQEVYQDFLSRLELSVQKTRVG